MFGAGPGLDSNILHCVAFAKQATARKTIKVIVILGARIINTPEKLRRGNGLLAGYEVMFSSRYLCPYSRAVDYKLAVAAEVGYIR
jgi:hypothetical protein